jgi:hypothetical protein
LNLTDLAVIAVSALLPLAANEKAKKKKGG